MFFFSLFPQRGEDGAEVVQAGFNVFYDVFREVGWLGEVVEVGEAFIFEPGDVQAGFVAGDDVRIFIFAPAAFGIFFGVPRLFAGVTIGGVVAGDEFREVFHAHGPALLGVVYVGAVIVIPNLFGPWLFGGGLVIEKQDVRLDAVGVKDAGGQAQDGVEVGVFQEPLPDGFADAALEQHVTRA